MGLGFINRAKFKTSASVSASVFGNGCVNVSGRSGFIKTYIFLLVKPSFSRKNRQNKSVLLSDICSFIDKPLDDRVLIFKSPQVKLNVIPRRPLWPWDHSIMAARVENVVFCKIELPIARVGFSVSVPLNGENLLET